MHLGPRVSSPNARPIEARGSVRRQPGGRWAGTFQIEQADFAGERHFEADSCADVAHAFALVLALAIDPNFTPPPTPPPPARPASPPTQPPRAAASPKADAGQRGRAWLLGVAARANVGLLPGLAPGAEVDVGVRWPASRFYLSGIFLPQKSDSLSGLSPAEGRYGLAGGGLTGCWGWPLGSFDVGLCARTHWGQAWAKSEGVARESLGRGLWGSAGAMATFGFSPGRWGALRAGVEGGASVLRPTFVIENSNAGYRWPAAYGGLTLGGEVYF